MFAKQQKFSKMEAKMGITHLYDYFPLAIYHPFNSPFVRTH
jgi:hypothetical protein